MNIILVFISAARATTRLTVLMEFGDSDVTQVFASVTRSASTVYTGYSVAPDRQLYFAIEGKICGFSVKLLGL